MWNRKKRIAEKNIKEGKMQFATESEERDYRNRVNSNPNNVYGLPAFYPAQEIRSSLNGMGLAHNCEKQGHRWSNTRESFCLECDTDKPSIAN